MNNQFKIAQEAIKQIEQLKNTRLDGYAHSLEIIRNLIAEEKAEHQKQIDALLKFGQSLHDAITESFKLPNFKLGNIAIERGPEFVAEKNLKPHQELIIAYNKLSSADLEIKELKDSLKGARIQISNLSDTLLGSQHEIECLLKCGNRDQEFIMHLKGDNVMLKKANKECIDRMQQMGNSIFEKDRHIQRLNNRVQNEKNFSKREIDRLYSVIDDAKKPSKTQSIDTLITVLIAIAAMIFGSILALHLKS